MHKGLSAALAGAALLVAATAADVPAEAQSGVKAGFLTCNVSSGWGFVFGSTRHLRCSYSSGAGPVERYAGTISKFGVDIGYVQSAVMVWGVIAPTATMAPGSLAGDYAGVTASATVGGGVGANVLVGGFNKSITLQPLSIEGNTGLNVAAGIGAIRLKYEP